jgi:hypothetical protein
MLSTNYEQKYLKYKNKYTELKKQQGGHLTLDRCAFFFSDKQLENFHKTHYGKSTKTKVGISYDPKEIMIDFDDLMQIMFIHRLCYYLSNKHNELKIALTDREDVTKNTRNEFNNGTIDTYVGSKLVYLNLKLNHMWKQSTRMFSRPNIEDFEAGKIKEDILTAFNTIKEHMTTIGIKENMTTEELDSLIPTHIVVIEFRTGRKDLIIKIAKISISKDGTTNFLDITNSELAKGTYPTSTIQYDTKIDRAITEIKKTDIICNDNAFRKQLDDVKKQLDNVKKILSNNTTSSDTKVNDLKIVFSL